MKNALLLLGFLISLNSFSTHAEDSVRDAVQRYLTALDRLDYDAYYEAILPHARSLEVASHEGMLFWHDELEQLKSQGFNGEFEVILYDSEQNDANIPEAFARFKNDAGELLNKGLFLMLENGAWWVVRPETYYPRACVEPQIKDQ